MFWITASVPFKVIGDYAQFKRRAETVRNVVGGNIIKPDVFERVASAYAISPDPRDYGFLSVLAVRADIPNNNGDAVSTEELLRFRPHRGCRTFETFINSPLHINHFASDYRLARGFIIDAILNKWDEPFTFVEVVVAVDKKKDPYLADALLSGKINKFSMGSLVETIQCSLSFCKKVAHQESELCDHLKKMRMQTINGELVFGWNIGVDYEELSVVENPAEKFAQTRKIFGSLVPRVASFVRTLPAREREAFRRVAEKAKTWGDLMGISAEDKKIILEFLRIYGRRIPPSVENVLWKVVSESIKFQDSGEVCSK